jgi:hypothetical protein
MIDQSTNNSDNNRVLERELLSLIESVPHYYVKSSSIENIYSIDGRKFYSKYRLVDEKPNRIVLNQHLNRELNIAIPLMDSWISIRYFGEYKKRFLYLLRRVVKRYDIEIETILTYRGVKGGSLDILIITSKGCNVQKLIDRIDKISLNLKSNLPKEWRVLPKKDLPKSYNIFPLPHKIYRT